MCLSFMVLNQIPEVPLMLLFNRDEDYARAAAPAHYWENEAPWIFAGRDLLKGGTWAGVNQAGQFGMLLFVREPRRSVTPRAFRGEIVPDFLRAQCEPSRFLETLHRRADDYLHFNVVLGSRDEVYHYSNRTKLVTKLDSGVHGVSNADLNDPWFKVVRGKSAIEEQLRADPLNLERSFTLMRDDQEATPEQVQHTGLPFDYERIRSPLFIRASDYGTRTTTVAIFQSSGEIQFVERTYGVNPSEISTVSL